MLVACPVDVMELTNLAFTSVAAEVFNLSTKMLNGETIFFL